MTEPAQKPFRSRQDYATPRLFIDAVTRRLEIDRFVHDFAASRENAQADSFFGDHINALNIVHWERFTFGQWGWLNPPFTRIGEWAKRCAETKDAGGKIAFLVPAAVGSNWFRDYVDGQARVLLLNGRITFAGQTDPYPKDCMLCLYGIAPGYEVWNWRV